MFYACKKLGLHRAQHNCLYQATIGTNSVEMGQGVVLQYSLGTVLKCIDTLVMIMLNLWSYACQMHHYVQL